jgi:hypothetical protein
MLACACRCSRLPLPAPQVRGIKTNLSFLENVLHHPEFLAGNATTKFIEKNAGDLFKVRFWGAAGVAAAGLGCAGRALPGEGGEAGAGVVPPSRSLEPQGRTRCSASRAASGRRPLSPLSPRAPPPRPALPRRSTPPLASRRASC